MLHAVVMLSTAFSPMPLRRPLSRAMLHQSHATASSSAARSNAQALAQDDGDVRVQPTGRSKRADARVAELQLKRQFPRGLAEQICASRETFPVAFWILDNSNGMYENDGQRFSVDSTGAMGVVRATRWQELSAEAATAAEMNHDIGRRAEFWFLNGMSSMMPMVVSGDRESEAREVAAALPGVALEGDSVPLAAATKRVSAAILPRVPGLLLRKQRACVVITTHGLPTDPGFEAALTALLKMPVWCIVRVCTDEARVVEYYNGLDKKLKLNLEVLDDVREEEPSISHTISHGDFPCSSASA